jgi:putative Ca2+/H+ antiporter (TMEM165/GDT1 family)
MGLLIGREAIKTKASIPEEACGDTGDGRACREPNGFWDWRTFGATFGLLFIAEMGDKTQLAVLSLAGRSEIPWSVFLGGTLALTAVTALGVVGGQGLCRLLPERLLLWISAAAFVVMGVLMGVGVL